MAKKNKNFIKILLTVVLLAVNILFALGLLFVFLAKWVPPTFSILITYCSLFFPYILIVNLFFVIFWIFIKIRYSLISLIFSLLNINNIDGYYQIRGMDKPEVCNNCIKVMSYNAQLLGLYNSNNYDTQISNRNEILGKIKDINPDILCLQEYFYENSNKIDFETTDTLLSILQLKNRSKRSYYCYFPVNYNKEYFFGQAIFSKYRIINKGYVPFTDSITANSAIYVDIIYRKDTIRIYSLHLESFHITNSELNFDRLSLNKQLNDKYLNKKAMLLSKKMEGAYKKRAIQAKDVKRHILECRFPKIICGDFNDTPASYTVRSIGSEFYDTFRKSGKGRGSTYIGGYFIPDSRIDYIFHDKNYNSFEHTVVTDLKISDHFPVYCYISLKIKN